MKSCSVTGDGDVIPRKTVFPAKSSRDVPVYPWRGRNWYRKRIQTWRRELPVLWGLQTCFCSKTTINIASMVSVSFRSIFFLVCLDLGAREMSLTATGPTEHWNEDHVWCSSDTDNDLANYSAKRRVAKGKLKAKAAVLLIMFIYWCLFSPK